MGLSGLEPPTSRLSGVRSNRLSYKPMFRLLGRVENTRVELVIPACKAGALPTELIPQVLRQPPALPCRLQHSTIGRPGLNHRVRDGYGCVPWAHRHRKFLYQLVVDNWITKLAAYLFFLRKEVIQPHLPIRLPCYDFTPVTGSTFDSSSFRLGHWLRAFPTPMV